MNDDKNTDVFFGDEQEVLKSTLIQLEDYRNSRDYSEAHFNQALATLTAVTQSFTSLLNLSKKLLKMNERQQIKLLNIIDGLEAGSKDSTAVMNKFIPTQFLKRIAKSGRLENIMLGGAENEVISILFCDIRAFTSIAETMTPEELLLFLNEYFSVVGAPIYSHLGFIDKFIGDAIMALFDQIEGLAGTGGAENALRAAVGMQDVLEQWNQTRISLGLPQIRAGIGIHSGPVVMGTVGTEYRMDTTVLGDNVNLASRLEGLTSLYGAKIIISSDTFGCLEDRKAFKSRELDWLHVKGKSQPITIYEIYNNADAYMAEGKKKTERYIKRGLFDRQTQDWTQAIESFRQALAIYPEDVAAKFHIEQCLALQKNPPPSDWDGAVKLDYKKMP
jgi:adenylate cyclase